MKVRFNPNKGINVTRSFLPPMDEYSKMLDGIWTRNWLTNHGPLVTELEKKLQLYLHSNHLLFLTNGTSALQIAIKAMRLEGEIITTPFSYVATTSSIVWEGCIPVFVDIHPDTFNIDPARIESAISNKTTAILATHVFGNACDIEGIEKIAKKFGLRVIYDGAHAFGVTYKNKTIFNYGDVATTSFHATKLFHTVEGGAVFTENKNLYHTMEYMRNFGHKGYEKFSGLGINAKNSEFHAAMGLCNLNYANDILDKRKKLFLYYDVVLDKMEIEKQVIDKNCGYNYAYYPVLFESEKIVNKQVRQLNKAGVFPRRYFYPSLNTLPYLKRQRFQISESVSKRILCLPLSYDLTKREIDKIAKVLLKNK
jgi:dTDP-4-amino-4,6-dideoxygalactose transaminase